MFEGILGIHHVTAISADIQRNYDFYVKLLGLRLVKKTVNFDDPGAYHLYYGDAHGTPGTILTFFSYPGGQKGAPGTGQATSFALAIPEGSLSFWLDRLANHQVKAETGCRFGEKLATIHDPDGLQVDLIESALKDSTPWLSADIGRDHAIAGIHSVSLTLEGFDQTAKLLHERMAYRAGPHDEHRYRYDKPHPVVGSILDLVCSPYAPRGRGGAGTIHHVAFRVENDTKQRLWRLQLDTDGYNVSPVMDRNYFHSIYFREPGHVLFEIATDPPGFAADEPMEKLGERLCLPEWMESHRTQIEQVLPPLKT